MKIACAAGTMAFLCGVTAFAAGPSPKADKAWGTKMPWQCWADIRTVPSLQCAVALTDGDTESTTRFTCGAEAGGEITMVFPKPIEVTHVRFTQRHFAATHYKVLADMGGTTNFTEIVLDRTDAKPVVDEWIGADVGKKVHGLKFVFIAGEVGYRSVFPKLAELEVYAKDRVAAGVGQSGGKSVRLGIEKPLPTLGRRTIDFRVCTDWWNYGIKGWEKACKAAIEKGEKPIDLRDWPEYKARIADFRELGVTSVRLFAESEACDPNGGSSSFPLEGLPKEQQHDWLRPLADALHKDGFKVYYFSHAWRVPIQKLGEQPPMPWLRWDYPYMQSDALVGINENYKYTYPCAISDDDFREKWTALLRGALKAGADGVYICPDEYYFKGHNLSRCTCKACQREFKAMYGYEELPKLKAPAVAQNAQGQVQQPLPVDTLQYRKWKLFEYRKLAGLFHRVAADLRKEFPKATLVINENQGAVVAANGRMENTVANDIFGDDATYDEKQVYGGGFAYTVDSQIAAASFLRHFTAACGGTKRLLSSSGWGPGNLTHPTEQLNGVVPQVFLGAPRYEIYRLNYMYEYGGVSTWKKTIKMVNLLDKWGISETRLPADVGFVFSRASEDWWFVKAAAKMDLKDRSAATDFNLNLADESINTVAKGGDDSDLARLVSQERLRGVGAQQAVESMLGSNGFAYDVLYADRADSMKDLKRYQVLVIPFGYALTDQAVAAIKEAYAAGSKLIIFDRLGEADEFGEKRAAPALADLVGRKGVTYFKDCPSDVSGNLKTLRKWREAVLKAVEKPSYVFDPNGRPVNALVRELPKGGGWLVFLANVANRTPPWRGTHSANVSFKFPSADGTYGIESFSSDSGELNAVLLAGSEDIAAKDLQGGIRVGVDAQEAKILRIFRK